MEQENLPLETIYVSIPSFLDGQLIPTVEDAFNKAEHPSRIFIGIALQDHNKKFLKTVKKAIAPYGDNAKLTFTLLTKKNASSELGVGKGRAKAHSFYNEEDYFLQIDSHTMFAEGWDSKLIELLAEAKIASQNKRTIISAYAGNYFLDADGQRILEFPENMEKHAGFYYPLYTRFGTRMGMPVWDTVPVSKISDTKAKFIPAPKFNANFAFGDSNFAHRLGLETTAVFFEEELVQTLNIMSSGWSIALPNIEDAIIRHYYFPPDSKDGAQRWSAGDYMGKFGIFEEMNARQRENYKTYLDTECRAENLEAYQRYANVDLRNGRLTDSMLHPTSWVLDTFDYETIVEEFNYVEPEKEPEAEEVVEEASEGCGCKNKHEHTEPAVQEEAPAEPVKEARPWDLLNPNIGRVSEEIKEMRMNACRNCEFFVKLTQQCTKCGCIMPAKTTLPHASCPVGKWDSVPDEG